MGSGILAGFFEGGDTLSLTLNSLIKNYIVMKDWFRGIKNFRIKFHSPGPNSMDWFLAQYNSMGNTATSYING